MAEQVLGSEFRYELAAMDYAVFWDTACMNSDGSFYVSPSFIQKP